MTDIIVVTACSECQVYWPLGADAAQCLDPEHHHQQHELHRHRGVVLLPDGTELVAVSFDESDPYGRDEAPDYGLYLDSRWQPPWPHAHLNWPDFGGPENAADLLAALRELHCRARAGSRVEIGCLGGHGRTGTALACLAVITGHPSADAVAWVRSHYCARAVETDDQAAFVATLLA